MDNENAIDVDLQGLDLGDESPVSSDNGAQQQAAPNQTPPTPQSAQAPALQPTAPQQQSAYIPTSPTAARIQEQINVLERQKQEALARKKQLEESGYEVPVELAIEIANYDARKEYLQLGLEDAMRRDVAMQVPSVAKRLLSELPPNVAKVTERHLQTVLESLAVNSPDAFRDPATLQSAVNLAVGMAVKEQMAAKLKSAAPATPSAMGVPNLPVDPAQQQQAAILKNVPEKFRDRVSAKSWAAVANADPDEPLSLFE